MKHERVMCKKVGIDRYGIAEWECPKCKAFFQCGNKNTKEMYCEGV